jgi:hypothetical protein
MNEPKYYKPKFVIPVVQEIEFYVGKRRCFVVEIEGEEYDVVVEASKDRWSNSKKGNYGTGLINTDKDPCYAERTGLLGEFGAAISFNLSVDISYQEGGDKGWDFLLFGAKLDTKNEAKLYPYEVGWVYAVNDWNKPVPLKSDIYVFSYTLEERRRERHASIVMVGYATKDMIEESPLKPGVRKGSKHKNREISFGKLRPIGELWNLYMEQK